GSRSGFSSDETAARNTEGHGISRCPQPKLKSHLLRQSWLSIMARHRVEIYNRNNALQLHPRASESRAAPASRRGHLASDPGGSSAAARAEKHAGRSRISLSIPRFFWLPDGIQGPHRRPANA